MYTPPHFAAPDAEAIDALMREHPLAAIVHLGPGGLDANHVPLRHDPDPAPLGTLRGHVARANPLWREIGDGAPALAIFSGPDAYISPSWYPSKREHGKVVPTWNYVVVHAHGRLRAIDDAAWLHRFLEGLTARHEAHRPAPWAMTDAPPDYLGSQLRAIVGLELAVERIEGKWKLSQNRTPADHAGVVSGLGAEPGPAAGALAARMDAKRKR